MAQIATLEDFQVLQKEIHLIQENLTEIKSIISNSGAKSTTDQRWLRSSDVRKLLGISHGKLQKMRDLKQVAYTKIDGIILYDRLEIERHLKNTYEMNNTNLYIR